MTIHFLSGPANICIVIQQFLNAPELSDIIEKDVYEIFKQTLLAAVTYQIPLRFADKPYWLILSNRYGLNYKFRSWLCVDKILNLKQLKTSNLTK